MTVEELRNLKIGDTVYYYNEINLKRSGSINASIITKKVFQRYESHGNVRIALERGGALLESFCHLFDTDKDRLLYSKLTEIKKRINSEIANNTLRYYKYDVVRKFEKVLGQKNVMGVLEKYPELLI